MEEKIRKELTKFLKSAAGGFLDTAIQCKTFGKWVAWLEKQGEQKPAWSKEDEELFGYALDMIEWYSGENENKSRLVSDWLKSLKEKIGG